jgi:hypothetical protein
VDEVVAADASGLLELVRHVLHLVADDRAPVPASPRIEEPD